MSELLPLLAAMLAGAGLGVLFFGGLRWSIAKGLASARPAVWFAASFLIRVTVILAGFFWIGRGDWIRLLAALLGFTLARPLVLRALRSWPKAERRCS